jgi:hypothetical protein
MLKRGIHRIPAVWILLPAVCANWLIGRYDVNSGYTAPGEALIHNLPGLSSYHLPLAGVIAALISSHSGVSRELIQTIYALVLTVLVLANECLLDDRAYFGLASAVALLLCGWSYPQEVFSLIVLIVAGLMIWRAKAASSSGVALLLALAIGVSMMFRSGLVFLPPVLAGLEFVLRRRDAGRSHWRQALILLVVPYLFLAPTLRMNWRLHHRIIPFEDGEASCNVVTGALGVVETIEGPWQALVPGRVDLTGGGALTWAAAEVSRHPLRYAVSFLARIGRVIWWFAPILPFALWGLWAGRKKKEFQALGVLIVYFVAVHCLMSVSRKYFDPLWPVFLLLTGSLVGDFTSQGNFISARFCKSVLAGSLALLLVLASYTIFRMNAYGADSRSVDQAISDHPNDKFLLRERGRERLGRGEFLGGAADLSRAADLQPRLNVFEMNVELAKAEMFAGRYDRVWRLEPRARDPRNPDLVFLYLIRADAWLRIGRPAKAREEIKAARGVYDASIFIRGTPDARTEKIAERLSEAGSREFAARVADGLEEWPIADKCAIASLLVELKPRYGCR